MATRVSLSLEPDTPGRLRSLAERLGFVAARGPYANQGNVSGLLDAIADGEVVLIRSLSEEEAALISDSQSLERARNIRLVAERVSRDLNRSTEELRRVLSET